MEAMVIRKLVIALVMAVYRILAVRSGQSSSGSIVSPDSMFAFGDSLSDTGNDASAFPGSKPSLHYGQTFFRKFAGRASDGRLLIDFLAQAFGLPFLSPYLQDFNADYRHGVNFAARGATARSTSIVTPFFLSVQVSQMIHFREAVLAAPQATPLLPNSTVFSTALYVIYIGINDFWQNLNNNRMTIQQINSTVVPQLIQTVPKALERLYHDVGARKFLIVTVPAVGCLPVVLSEFGSSSPEDYDASGCLRAFDDVVGSYNARLRSLALGFAGKFAQARVFFGDIFAVHKDVIANPELHGFAPSSKLSACCGGGGKLHEAVKQCGVIATPVCESPSSYISWDGIHFTDAFNRVAAASILGSIPSI
ncbi:GDSL esterase/lipase At4g01130 [Selaginella moellendorffii]|nr:GDSL esterase/lipase At4g01130 [Selaginella moellendorffii]|eukprot:XP_002971563.2 GDSL esterase/lipase At4g01130 [Selaginella moellendorffii]